MLLSIEAMDSYYDQSRVVSQVSLEIAPGEVVGLLGRNGVGKSTTLKSIMGAVKPRSGSIRFNGEEITGKPPHLIARAGIGYVPEDRRIFPGLTVRENLQMGIRPGSFKLDGQDWAIDKIFAKFPQLKRRERIAAGHLSGGEKQLLTMARTMMGNPVLMLVDEPSEGLSPIVVGEIFELLQELNRQGMAILLVDQNLAFSCALACRVYIMQKGHIVHHASGKEVLGDKKCQEKYLAV